MVQLSMWVAVPSLLVQAGLPRPQHWWVYLPTVLLSFVVMGGLLFPLERRGHLRAALRAAVALVLLVQLGLWLLASHSADAANVPSIRALALLLLLFFCGFNALEASQPSLISRLAEPGVRGAALGVYNTLQSLGLFAGGALGGALLKWGGAPSLFAVTSGLSLLWLLLTWHLQPRPSGP